MKNIVYGLFMMALMVSGKASAQEVMPIYSDYLTDNLYLLHPSMAGAGNMNKIRLTARQQWFDVQDAPSLQTVSINGRVGEKTGLGGILFNDKNGNFSRRGVYGTYAYHLMFSRSNLDLNQLSFGISAGLIQHSLDQTGFSTNDPVMYEGTVTDLYANMDVGMSYYYFDFFAHLTAKNILAINRDLFYSDNVESNQRRYLVSTGYNFNRFGNPWSFEPSVLFQWTDATGEKAIDVNLKAYHGMENGGVFGGVSYRRSFEGIQPSFEGNDVTYHQLQYLTPFLGMEYKNFLFAYTYSQQLNSVVLSNQGFHQITLGFNFGKSRERYDCFCPGINDKWY